MSPGGRKVPQDCGLSVAGPLAERTGAGTMRSHRTRAGGRPGAAPGEDREPRPGKTGGRAGEAFTIRHELAGYGAGPDWFTLGDRDFGTHIARSQLLAEGHPLSAVTEVLCRRWQPGVRLLPMSDDQIETHVLIDDGDG